MIDFTLYQVDLDTARPNPFDNTQVLHGDSPRTAFTKYNDLLWALHDAVVHIGPLAPASPSAYMMWLDTGAEPPINKRRNSENTAWLVVESVLPKAGSTVPTLTEANQMSFQLESDTSLKVFVRGSDGVTRSATLALT